jgi:hypothetical protein
MNRYYDPSTGGFVSIDPDVMETGQAYAYAGDDPVDNVDPNGLCVFGGSWCNGAQNLIASSFDQFRHSTASLVDIPPSLVMSTGETIYNSYDNVYQDGANHCPFFSLGTQEDIGGAVFADASAVLFADGGGEAADGLASVSETAYRAADNVDSWTVKARHLPGAGGTYSKFAYGVDPNAAVADALRSPDATFRPNPNQNIPASFIVQSDVGFVVGSNGQTSVRVVVSRSGTIITAFPVK